MARRKDIQHIERHDYHDATLQIRFEAGDHGHCFQLAVTLGVVLRMAENFEPRGLGKLKLKQAVMDSGVTRFSIKRRARSVLSCCR